jgi:GTP-binding protein
MKKDWEFNIREFIEKRKNIKVFIYLIDSRHRDLDIDKNSIA